MKDIMNNTLSDEKTAEEKYKPNKIAIVIIIILVSVILTCVLSVFVKVGPKNDAAAETAEQYVKACAEFDYDTYNELIFIDEETYYTLLYSKYAEQRGLTLDEYIKEINKTDYFSFEFQTIDEFAYNLFMSDKNTYGQYSVDVHFDRMITYSPKQLEMLKDKLQNDYERRDGDYLSNIETIDITQTVDVNDITAAYEIVLDFILLENGETKGSSYRVVVIEYDSQFKVIDNRHYNASFLDYSEFYKEICRNIVFTDSMLIKIAVRYTIACVCIIAVLIVQKKKYKNIKH